MTVHGLWALLHGIRYGLPYCDLVEKKIAININNWLKLQFKTVQHKDNITIKTKILIKFFKKLCELYLLRIKPIFVFDGLSRKIINDFITNDNPEENIDNNNTNTTENIVDENNTKPKSIHKQNLINIYNNNNEYKNNDFYTNIGIKKIDINSDEFNNLSFPKQYEYLNNLKNIFRRKFNPKIPACELSKYQLFKTIELGKINEKLNKICDRSNKDIKSKYVSKFSDSFHCWAGRCFSKSSDYYIYLRKHHLVDEEEIEIPKLHTIFYDTKKMRNSFLLRSYEKKRKSINFPLPNKISRVPGNIIVPSSYDTKINDLNIDEDEDDQADFNLYNVDKKFLNEDDFNKHISKGLPTTINDVLSLHFHFAYTSVMNNDKKTENKMFCNDDEKIHFSTYEKYDDKYNLKMNEFKKEFIELHSKSPKLPSDFFSDCLTLIKLFGFTYIIAPHEADAECANIYKNKLCDYISSEDTDSLLFGCTKIIRGLFQLHKQKVEFCYPCVKLYDYALINSILGLNQSDIIALSMLVGCDYSEGIHGVGIARAFKLYSLNYTSNILDTLKNIQLKIQSQYAVPTNFPSENTVNIFLQPITNTDYTSLKWSTLDVIILPKFLISRFGWKAFEVNICMSTLINRCKYSLPPLHHPPYIPIGLEIYGKTIFNAIKCIKFQKSLISTT